MGCDVLLHDNNFDPGFRKLLRLKTKNLIIRSGRDINVGFVGWLHEFDRSIDIQRRHLINIAMRGFEIRNEGYLKAQLIANTRPSFLSLFKLFYPLYVFKFMKVVQITLWVSNITCQPIIGIS